MGLVWEPVQGWDTVLEWRTSRLELVYTLALDTAAAFASAPNSRLKTNTNAGQTYVVF